MIATSELLKKAEQAARETETWADLSNVLFNPEDGLVSRAFPSREAREAFIKTEEYQKIRQLVSDARERHGLVPGGTPKLNGQLLVELPPALHLTLEREAAATGISLNDLILARLACTTDGLELSDLDAHGKVGFETQDPAQLTGAAV